MTGTERKMIIAMAVSVLALVVSIKGCSDAIKSNGGLRTLIVEAGKEVKSISKEINDDET